MSSSWNTTSLEEDLRDSLISDLGKSDGEATYGKYTTAREYLLNNILSEIARIQTELTDHGPEHVRNVMENVSKLLQGELSAYDGVEKYCMLMSILFHDVGNIFNRKNHHKEVSQIYDLVFPDILGSNASSEKQIILSLCQAHCGKAQDESNDTLKFVPFDDWLLGKPIRTQHLATILRFADELAEGEQRTSKFIITHPNLVEALDKFSLDYHLYANCSSINIDRAGGRICCTYQIHIADDEQDKSGEAGIHIKMSELTYFLEFIYCRIEKLNQERKYSKYYNPLLEPFKVITIAINFWYKSNLIPTDLQQLKLTDLVIPGESHLPIHKIDANYDSSHLVPAISNNIKKINENEQKMIREA